MGHQDGFVPVTEKPNVLGKLDGTPIPIQRLHVPVVARVYKCIKGFLLSMFNVAL